MSALPTQAIESPVGGLEWVIISGEGKEDLSSNMKYQASLVLPPETAEALKADMDAFWEANRPKHISTPKSMGFIPHRVPTGEEDDDGNKLYEETGNTSFLFKTGTTYKDGKEKVIPVFNAKGSEVSLGDKKIGNGSRGRIKGAMAIYHVKAKTGGKVLQAGVTLYLNGVQLSKFVEYTGGTNFDAIEDEGADFEGFGDVGAIPDESKAPATGTTKGSDKPKL